MTTESISFKLPDGSTNGIQLYQPVGDVRAVIMVFPAMGVKASFYKELGRQLADNGFAAALCDLRGIGSSSVRASRKQDFGYEEMLRWDYSVAYHRMQERYAGKQIFFLGHSMGGQLGSLFAADHPAALAGLILVASCSAYYKGWTGFARWRIFLATQFMGIFAKLVGYWPGKQLGFGGLEAAGVIRDWSRQARTEKYMIGSKRQDYEQKLSQVSLPALSISFEADQFCSSQAAKNLYQKYSKAAEVHHIHLMPEDPRNEQFSHFNWAKKPAKIIAMINDWVDALPNI